MAVRITCINKPSGDNDNPHEAISHYGWLNEENNQKGKSTRPEMVDWIENKGGQAYVTDRNGNKVFCEVRQSIRGTKFLQTIADGRYTNNLLELPECN